MLVRGTRVRVCKVKRTSDAAICASATVAKLFEFTAWAGQALLGRSALSFLRSAGATDGAKATASLDVNRWHARTEVLLAIASRRHAKCMVENSRASFDFTSSCQTLDLRSHTDARATQAGPG